MEHIKVAKVHNVILMSRGNPTPGTLHLTAHHLIFSSSPVENQKPLEMWVCYPIIHTVERRQPLGLGVEGCALRFRCRDFNFFTLTFPNEAEGKDVFESVQKLTCVGSPSQLYAYFYDPGKAEKKINSWGLYQPAKEFARMGVGTTTHEWRITHINKDYSLCASYPAVLAVPSKISDNVLGYAAKFRSKSRLPALTYLHSVNQCSITRCAQPLVGFKQSRSVQDEKLITAIFATTHPEGVISSKQNNLIVDSRPVLNATAQQAMGAGSENMENYKEATKIYVPIENIHVMRDSLSKVVEALKDGDASPFPPNKELLAKSGWLKHLSVILDGTAEIVQTIHIRHSHVVLHCSDGWDRTSQLSALSQICLDPFYRTFEGFMILVEKDFLSFGHMFAKRSGHLSNEKFFIDRYVQQSIPQVNYTESPPTSGRTSPSAAFPATVVHSTPSPSPSGTSAAAAARGALSNMASRMSLKSSNSKPPQMKETSPVFHQFLDSVYQLLYIHPNRFQFNERFLRRLLYHAYSCQYGSFLYDSEKERVEAKVRKHTRCVWDYFLARRKEFMNPEFDPALDIREGVLFPKGENVRWWAQGWGRTDSEMNGPGRGTNVRDDPNKPREEREPIKARLDRAVKLSPTKELPTSFEGLNSSPSRSDESLPLTESSPSKSKPSLPVEVLADSQDHIIEVDPSEGKIDPPNDETIVKKVMEQREGLIEDQDGASSQEQVVDGNISEDNGLGASGFVITNPVDVELDPLGGGVEMTTLRLSSPPLRNR